MSHVRTNLIVGTLATLAAMAYVTLRERMREQRLQGHPQAEIRWEGEGGNVPEVAVEAGIQGQSELASPPTFAAASDEHNFQFPRA
jgi:hypothetical protein